MSDTNKQTQLNKNTLTNSPLPGPLPSTSKTAQRELYISDHAKYFQRLAQFLPSRFEQYDMSRLNILYFAANASTLLGQFDSVFPSKDHKCIVDWVYATQIPSPASGEAYRSGQGGFNASTWAGFNLPTKLTEIDRSCIHYQGHLTYTFTALSILKLFGDDFSRVDISGIRNLLKTCQTPRGGFNSVANGGETDMRFNYCAACIAELTNTWDSINIPAFRNTILSAQTFEGAFGQRELLEAHGGSTFCALAALKLINDGTFEKLPRKESLVKWLCDRQQAGFNGRCNKVPDVCYSWWIGGSHSLLGITHLINKELILSHTFACQKRYVGGFSKHPNLSPDPLHSHHGLLGLKILEWDIPGSINTSLTQAIPPPKSMM